MLHEACPTIGYNLEKCDRLDSNIQHDHEIAVHHITSHEPSPCHLATRSLSVLRIDQQVLRMPSSHSPRSRKVPPNECHTSFRPIKAIITLAVLCLPWDNCEYFHAMAFVISSPIRIARHRKVVAAFDKDTLSGESSDNRENPLRQITTPTSIRNLEPEQRNESNATIRGNSKFSSKKVHYRVDNLNKEIFRLRKERNGVDLAERRLKQSIQDMITNTDRVNQLLQQQSNATTTNTTQELDKFPNEISFNAVLSALAKNAKRDPMASVKAEQLLQEMNHLAESFPHLRPSIFSYNAVLEAYTKNCNPSGNSKRSQQAKLAILRIFRKLQREDHLQPNTFTHNLLLSSNSPSSSEWLELEKWAWEYFDHPTTISVEPDRNTYNNLFQCYATNGDADKAQTLLQKMIQFTTTPLPSGTLSTDFKVSPVWFNLVLKALAVSAGASTGTDYTNRSLGQQADNLLDQMYQLYKSGYNDQLHPQTSTYNHVLNVHTMLGDTDRAEQLVAELEQAFVTNSIDGIELRPDHITFTTLIKGYATQLKHKRNSSTQLAHDLALNATRVYEKMESLTNAGWEDMKPNSITYNTLISIWSNVGTREALNMAATLFQKMCEDPQNPPDSFTYTILIHGWSKGMKHLARFPEAGYRAEQLLQQLEQLPPSRQRKDFSPTKVYNSVITAWSRSGEAIAADKVETLLSRLEGKYLSGMAEARPTKTTFLCMIGAYAKSRIPDAEERCDRLLHRMLYYRDHFGINDLEPDQMVYNAILNALAKSCQPSAVEKAEEIVTMMQTSPDQNLRPDIVTYSTLIDCHTKCGEGSARRAEELLRFVEGTYRNGDKTLEPSAVFYSAILQAWAKTGTPEGAKKAEELLRRNIALYEEGNSYAKPHAIMYNAVMDAIARTGDPTAGQRAEELLMEMEALYQAGDDELKPTRRSYNAVILAYRNAGDGGRKAEKLLLRMEELAEAGRPELTPDVVSYNCAISAIVENGSDNEVADRAQALLDRMEDRRIQPDGRTYSPVIKAWLQRNDEKGHALAEMMLQQFLDKVESKKKSKGTHDQNLYEDAVWDVINAYRKAEGGEEESNEC